MKQNRKMNADQKRLISWWLKNYNLRQVQYLAGHEYGNSTELYQLNNLDKLQEQMDKYHPLANRKPLRSQFSTLKKYKLDL